MDRYNVTKTPYTVCVHMRTYLSLDPEQFQGHTEGPVNQLVSESRLSLNLNQQTNYQTTSPSQVPKQALTVSLLDCSSPVISYLLTQ